MEKMGGIRHKLQHTNGMQTVPNLDMRLARRGNSCGPRNEVERPFLSARRISL
jgi:hypothetical protein